MNRATLSLCCPVLAAALAWAGEERPDLTPRVYATLPFDLSKVKGMERAKLPKEAKALLAKNGFVVVGPAHGYMTGCYEEAHKVPALVTLDSVIEVLLSDFEEAWRRLEKRQAQLFAELQAELWDALLAKWESIPQGRARAAATRLLGLAAVGRSLAAYPDDWWEIPKKLPAGVDGDKLRSEWSHDAVAAMKGKGVSESRLWKRRIDWSAFKPVGPYVAKTEFTHEEEATRGLSAYYRLSQWWGMQGLRSVKREERLCAAILSWAVGDHGELKSKLHNIEAVYNRFFGRPDDLTLAHIDSIMLSAIVYTKLRFPEDFGSDRFDAYLDKRLRKLPRPWVIGEWDARETLWEWRRRGQGVRLLPPRLTPEAKAASLVLDALKNERLLPRGLDVLAAFGNERARQLTLEAEPNVESRTKLDAAIGESRKALAAKDEKRLVLSVDACLRQLCVAIAGPVRDRRVPLFMRSPPYRDRGLAAALATWVGVREVTSVRIKAAIRGGGIVDLPGLVEPDLDAWQRLVEFCHILDKGFSGSGIEFPKASIGLALVLRRIAEKQLRGEALSKAERDIFPHYQIELDEALDGDRRVCLVLGRSVWPDDRPGPVRWAGKAVCDIYAIIEYGGELVLCKGGVFDYREFDLPPGRALTREDFRKLMDSEGAPKPPEWTRSYRVEVKRRAATGE